jgi:hypothetical protein
VTDDALQRVEAACAELVENDETITFAAVARRAGLGRATLYRRTELRAVVDEHRARAHEAHTLSGLATEIRQLRSALETVTDKVRRHEETLHHLTRHDSN